MDINKFHQNLFSLHLLHQSGTSVTGILYMCVEFALTGLYEKTKWTHNGWITDGYCHQYHRMQSYYPDNILTHPCNYAKCQAR